jgi:DNA replication protein DnaC
MKTFAGKSITRGTIMLNNATLGQLRELRLSAMADCFMEQQGRTDISALTFEERFAFLVEAEWFHRRNKRTGRLVRQAAFRFPASIEDIDWQGKKGINKPEIIKHSLGAYIKKAQNIIISGPTGIGKTYIACALGYSACAQGTQVVYTRLSDYFQNVFDGYNGQGRKIDFRKKCSMVPLLIIDDWGLKKFSLDESAELSDLFERRYGRASTIISGQVPSSSWHELFPDPTQADSILDRIVHNAHSYSITGESMRRTIGKRSLESPDS